MMQQTKEQKKKVLHVGCGPKNNPNLHDFFKDGSWDEVRFDINPGAEPDIVGDMLDMNMIENDQFDAIYSSHNIEHVFYHQVLTALKEFFRVLKPGGFAYMRTPDIQKVGEAVAKGNLEGGLYNSPAGPISGLDIMYGHSAHIAAGKTYMAHRTAFTAGTLASKLEAVGFDDIMVQRVEYDLYAKGYKNPAKIEGKKANIKIIQPDINLFMQKRDELDQEPKYWSGMIKDWESKDKK